MTISVKIGFGKKVSGDILLFGGKGSPVSSRDLTEEINGKIVVFLKFVPREFVEKAGFLGAVGIMVPSMHWRDFDYFSKTGDFSLLLLMKFGRMDVPEELTKKMEALNGKMGTMDGENKTLSV